MPLPYWLLGAAFAIAFAPPLMVFAIPLAIYILVTYLSGQRQQRRLQEQQRQDRLLKQRQDAALRISRM